MNRCKIPDSIVLDISTFFSHYRTRTMDGLRVYWPWATKRTRMEIYHKYLKTTIVIFRLLKGVLLSQPTSKQLLGSCLRAKKKTTYGKEKCLLCSDRLMLWMLVDAGLVWQHLKKTVKDNPMTVKVGTVLCNCIVTLSGKMLVICSVY